MNDNQLINLYNLTSKHSHYQVLAKPLRDHIPTDMLETHSRFEQERLEYILKHMPLNGISIADIGGNTGYFTLEFIDRGVKSALIIEGNQEHSAFVREAVNVLGWQDRVKVHPYYMKFEDDLSLVDVDVCLLLNVLHHVGDDYGDSAQSIESAKQNMLDSLSRMAQHTQFLIFQLGFNWKGSIDLPLFRNGTKKELIDFVESGTRDSWQINNVGIAETSSAGIVYNDLNSNNIQRQDSLGEFLNRPLFIMQSKLSD
jgi:SAM-dependent methyltransferase